MVGNIHTRFSVSQCYNVFVILSNYKHYKANIFLINYYTGDRGRAYISDLRFVNHLLNRFVKEIIIFLLLYYSASPLVMSLTRWRPKGDGRGYAVIKIINVIVL